MKRIKALSLELANQIAAGEVVERPASVIKELLENSLDAAATRIDIRVEKGGVQCIEIRDNGQGIDKDDLILAISPHATSKIASLHDLEQVMSLGFRGEALASISSVSRLTLSSRTGDAESAWQIKAQGRDPKPEFAPVALAQGTSILVEDLFFNTPARRKFLRSEKTEFIHIEDMVKKLALARFDIALSLQHNARRVLQIRPASDEASYARRVAQICGQSFVDHSLQINAEAQDFRLWGWLGLPTFSRGQTDLQYFYVNGRFIRDKVINHGIRQAFHEKIPVGRFPCYVLFLELPPDAVDVNVHPTKHEVRFHQSRLVHDFILRRLRDALEAGEENLPLIEAGDASIIQAPNPPIQQTIIADSSGVTSMTPTQSVMAEKTQNTSCAKLPTKVPPPRQFKQPTVPYMAVSKVLQAKEGMASFAPKGPLGKPLFYLPLGFILSQASSDYYLLNFGKARQYLLETQLQQALEEGAMVKQPLLVPETLSLSTNAIKTFEQQGECLAQLGFSLHIHTETSLIIRERPALMQSANIQVLLLELLGMLANPQYSRQRCLAHMAKAASTIPPSMSYDEMNSFLRQVEKLGYDNHKGMVKLLDAASLAHYMMSGA